MYSQCEVRIYTILLTSYLFLYNMKKSAFLFLILFLCGLWSCYPSKPRVAFEKCPTPTEPRYGDLKYWAAHPQKLDSADVVPDSMLSNQQETAVADVFYIHPTTYIGSWGENKWNAPLSKPGLIEDTDEGAVRNQASIFNDCYRIYAPRYRQAHYQSYKALKKRPTDAGKAFEVAYADIKKAFTYYLEHYNEGRPILLVGHSQGTTHGKRLISDFFDGKKLKDQLVAAYLVGLPVEKDAFQTIPPCQNASDNGCFASWRTMRTGHYPKYHDETDHENIACINPVNWSTSGEIVGTEQHQGMVLLDYYDGILQLASNVQISEAVVWIDRPKFPGSFLFIDPDYHSGDFNLFYMNVRQNACERLDHFLNP